MKKTPSHDGVEYTYLWDVATPLVSTRAWLLIKGEMILWIGFGVGISLRTKKKKVGIS